MLPFFLLLIQASPAALEPSEKPIVITARRLADTERALKECLARKCPPTEDIDRSLAHAENQFLAGDYKAARATLLASRHRNARYAKTLPVPVSDLLRANARLAGLNGLAENARINTIDTLDALKAGLKKDDARILMQRLEVGDVFAKQGRLEAASDVYDRVAKQGHAAKLPNVEGSAMLRAAVLYGAIASVNRRYKPTAREAIARIQETDDPALAPFRDAAVILKAQLAAYDGDDKAIDAALAEIQAKATTRPILIFAPLAEPDPRPAPAPVSNATVKMHGRDDAQWADVGFWIAPSGSVRDIDILRQSKAIDPSWLKRATDALAKRRYAPLAMTPGSPGLLRVERFSYVYDVTYDTGSRFPVRSARGHLEVLDLTADPAPSAPARPQG